MFFFLSARFEQLDTAQKLGIFKFFFLFHFVIIFSSLSSHPVPARPLFLIVLHNGVKNIHVRKALFVTWYRNREYQTRRCLSLLRKQFTSKSYKYWLFITLKVGDKTCNFVVLYRSPSQSQDKFETFSDNFEMTLDILAQKKIRF